MDANDSLVGLAPGRLGRRMENGRLLESGP